MSLRNALCLLLLLSIPLFTGCAKKLKPSELASDINVGQTYYTQFSLYQEKNIHRTTNYRRGSLIPINTPVELVAVDSKNIQLRLKQGGAPLTIENVPKHTNEDVQAAFHKILARRQVDLNRFTKTEQDAIREGQVRKGMSRNAVQYAIGFPPANSTPLLASDDWMYWASRYDRFVVHFKADKVAEIRD